METFSALLALYGFPSLTNNHYTVNSWYFAVVFTDKLMKDANISPVMAMFEGRPWVYTMVDVSSLYFIIFHFII